jgi:hypothetical protein
VPTSVVKKWAVGGDTSLGELIFGVFGFATKEPNLVSSYDLAKVVIIHPCGGKI